MNGWTGPGTSGKSSLIPPIIDQEAFALVQNLRQRRRRPAKSGIVSMFSGLLYCAGCGEKLYYSVTGSSGGGRRTFSVPVTVKIPAFVPPTTSGNVVWSSWCWRTGTADVVHPGLRETICPRADGAVWPAREEKPDGEAAEVGQGQAGHSFGQTHPRNRSRVH